MLLVLLNPMIHIFQIKSSQETVFEPIKKEVRKYIYIYYEGGGFLERGAYFIFSTQKQGGCLLERGAYFGGGGG